MSIVGRRLDLVVFVLLQKKALRFPVPKQSRNRVVSTNEAILVLRLSHEPGLRTRCFVRRIWAQKISFFVPPPRDVAHPGSGPAQDWLRICSGLLTLRTISGRLRYSMCGTVWWGKGSQLSTVLGLSETLRHCCDHYQSDQEKRVVLDSPLGFLAKPEGHLCISEC